jgi:hypothetical protein
MFRKLTTIIDSKLVREMDSREGLRSGKGFEECLLLGHRLVSVAFQPPENIMDLFSTNNPMPFGMNADLYSSLRESRETRVRHHQLAIQQAARIESVVSLLDSNNIFMLVMYCYRSGEKDPFYRVRFHVNFIGEFVHANVDPKGDGPSDPGHYVSRIV